MPMRAIPPLDAVMPPSEKHTSARSSSHTAMEVTAPALLPWESVTVLLQMGSPVPASTHMRLPAQLPCITMRPPLHSATQGG